MFCADGRECSFADRGGVVDDITREFLIESNENLASLDQQIVQLEQNPSDAGLLASVFRTMHTIKGTGGMLGFSAVEGIAHLAESLLSQVRGGMRPLTPALTSLILKAVDAVKAELVSIESTGREKGVNSVVFGPSVSRLQAALNSSQRC